MAYILYLHPVAPKSSLSVPYQWFLVIDQCMWEYFAVLRRHHVIYLTFNTINTSNLIYLRHPYGGFTRQQMILCCFCFHLAALSVNGRSERLLFQPLYKCRRISLINDTGIAVVQDDLHIKLFAADFSSVCFWRQFANSSPVLWTQSYHGGVLCEYRFDSVPKHNV